MTSTDEAIVTVIDQRDSLEATARAIGASFSRLHDAATAYQSHIAFVLVHGHRADRHWLKALAVLDADLTRALDTTHNLTRTP